MRLTRQLAICGALLLALSQCEKPLVVVPPPPDPEAIPPFHPDTLLLFYELTIDQAESFIRNHPDAVIVDVRQPEHFAAAHIPGARNFPAPSDTYDADITTALDRGAKILIYGYASDYLLNEYNAMDAVNVLRKAQYRNLYWMTHGYPAWIEAKKPVVDNQGRIVEEPPQGPMPAPKPEGEAGKAVPAPK